MRYASLRARHLLTGLVLSGILSAGATGAAWVLGPDPHAPLGALLGAEGG